MLNDKFVCKSHANESSATEKGVLAAASKTLQFDSLMERVAKQQEQLQHQNTHAQDLHRALSQSQANKQHLEEQLKSQISKINEHQLQVAELTEKVSILQRQLSSASDCAAEVNMLLGEEQQATIAVQHELVTASKQAAAEKASRQHAQQQLDTVRQLMQEKEVCLNSVVDQLDTATSAVAAKEGSIQLLRQQVMPGRTLYCMIPACSCQTRVKL